MPDSLLLPDISESARLFAIAALTGIIALTAGMNKPSNRAYTPARVLGA